MAGFSIVTSPNPVVFEKKTHNGGVFAIGDIVVLERTSDAYEVTTWALSNASTLNLCGIAMEATTSSSTKVLVALIDNQQQWKCESTSTADTDDNSLRHEMTDGNTVANTSSDITTTAGIFEQTGIAATKVVVGKFIKIGQAAA